MRLTIACPEALIIPANHLSMALGQSTADGATYAAFNWLDDDGNLYTAASLIVSPAFVATATGPLQRPEWDTESAVDLALAAQAQAAVVLWAGEGDVPQANPAQIVAVAGDDGLAALAAMGLTRVEGDL